MSIQVTFDDDRLLRNWRSGKESWFGIFWEHDGIQYPGPNWGDFGTVILGWWMGAAFRLLEGAKDDKFQFMEGPYAIRVSRLQRSNQVLLQPEGLTISWTCTLPELARDLVDTTRLISAHFAELGIQETWCLRSEEVCRKLTLRVHDSQRADGQ